MTAWRWRLRQPAPAGDAAASDSQAVEERKRGQRPTRDELALLEAGLLTRN